MPASLAGFERAVAEQHLANFELWHAEDGPALLGPAIMTSPASSASSTAPTSGATISPNSAIVLLLDFLRRQNLPAAGAELHSESPGLILDRLSILSLKLFHTREEIDRHGAPSGHTERNRERLHILVEQRDDLAASLDRLWQQVLDRQRSFKLYRQLKMYNDPALNPAVYGPGSNS